MRRRLALGPGFEALQTPNPADPLPARKCRNHDITGTDVMLGPAYAETVLVPALVGAHMVMARESETVRVVKAYVQ